MQQEKLYNVFQEIVIVKLLSNLHATQCNHQGFEFRAHCFPKVYQTCVVDGAIPLNGVKQEWVQTHHGTTK